MAVTLGREADGKRLLLSSFHTARDGTTRCSEGNFDGIRTIRFFTLGKMLTLNWRLRRSKPRPDGLSALMFLKGDKLMWGNNQDGVLGTEY